MRIEQFPADLTTPETNKNYGEMRRPFVAARQSSTFIAPLPQYGGVQFVYSFRTGLDLLTHVEAVEFVREGGRGKTEPLLLTCEKTDGSTVEVFTKLLVGCDEKEVNLAREAIGACLAADLGLPIPEPFVVHISQEFADSVPQPRHRDRLSKSRPYAFGSKLVAGGWSNWTSGAPISAALQDTAVAVFCFDAIIQNPDRRGINTNCLVKQDEVRIFDHELAFAHKLMLFWKAPWILGSLKSLETPGAHIFRAGLVGRAIDFGPIKASWQALSDERIQSYWEGLPSEWQVPAASIEPALALIRDARDNIDGCLQEIQRVLT